MLVIQTIITRRTMLYYMYLLYVYVICERDAQSLRRSRWIAERLQKVYLLGTYILRVIAQCDIISRVLTTRTMKIFSHLINSIQKYLTNNIILNKRYYSSNESIIIYYVYIQIYNI